VNISRLPNTDVVLLYPEESLTDQIRRWIMKDPRRRVEVSYERSLPGIRRLLRQARMALVDATEDPSQATDAFLQAIAALGVDAVAMYTEIMHDGLEVFVRSQGSLFFLGPLFDTDWASFFERLPARRIGVPPARRLPAREERILPRGFD
jgi:hypothetical protein